MQTSLWWFRIQNVMIQKDILSPLLFDFAVVLSFKIEVERETYASGRSRSYILSRTTG
jgi:hypothetical protein